MSRLNRPGVPPQAEHQGAIETNEIRSLILVEDHAINHHAIACSDVVNADGDADFESRSYRSSSRVFRFWSHK
jgi:hypothetical protein